MVKSRILAIVMSVLMMISMLPATVFAAETAVQLDGDLKIKGKAIEGEKLSADFEKVKPKDLTEDDVSFLWERKDTEDDTKEELSKKKTYKITEDDIGYEIVLTIKGLEDQGFTGKLSVSTKVVKSKDEAQKDSSEEENKEETVETAAEEIQEEPEVIPEESEEILDEEVISEELVEEETYDYEDESDSDEDESELDGDEWGELVPYSESEDEEVSEEMTPVDGEELEEIQDVVYGASVSTEDGSGVLDFGTIEADADDTAYQFVTITNTGNGTLNFEEIAPEHFMVEDIEEPLEAGQEITLWIIPRNGLAAGDYNDSITYTTEEGIEVSFNAKVTVAENAVEELPEDPEGESEEIESEEIAEPKVVIEDESIEDQDVPEEENTDSDISSEEENVNTEVSSEEETSTEEEIPSDDAEEPDDSADDEEPAATEIIDVSAEPESLEFASVTEGYEEAPEAQTVTIINNGSSDINLEQPAENAYFEIGELSDAVLPAGESVTFTVQPKLGLEANTYVDSIALYSTEDSENELVSVEVSFEVDRQVVHKLTVTTLDTLDFGTVTKGYKEAPAAQKVTVLNEGTETEILQFSESDDFVISGNDSAELNPGESYTFTVQPKTGLGVGSYLETIQISNDSEILAEVQVTLTVQKKADTSVNLTAIQNPSKITGLDNGTEKSVKGLKLPSTVVIETTNGEMKAAVTWDVKGCAYDPKSTSEQTFKVSGTVTLPDGVKNPDEISLVASVKVSVDGYTANVVSADDNQITGITPNGQYTTKSTISFTAVGAGMDNSDPRKGDIRYLPISWTVINTNTWSSKPYAASFGMGRSGNYTLTVTFSRQEYDGSNWVGTGTQDTKKVAFSVVQAAEQTVTPTPTPGANQRTAVKTGDDTPILPFVLALVVAVLCIAGIVVYRKKK